MSQILILNYLSNMKISNIYMLCEDNIQGI